MKIKEFFVKRKSSIIHLMGSLGLLLIAGGVGVGIGLYKTNGVDKYIMEAHDYYKDNNWVALYNYAELKDDDFINEFFFEELAKKKYGYVNEDTLKLGEVKKNDNGATVEMYYADSLGDKISCDFVMDKLPEKNYVFFNEWKLNIDNLIINQCTIEAPSDVKIYLDGVELNNNNSRIGHKGAVGNVEYMIPRLFKGEHTIFIERDMIEPQEIVVNWNEDKSVFTVDTSQFVLVEGATSGIENYSENIVKLMYKNVFEETELEGLDAYIDNKDNVKEEFKGIYDKILSAIQPEDGSTLNSLSITGFENFALSYTYPDKVAVSVDYNCTFKARGPRNAANGAREKYEGETKSNVTMEYIFNGENWVCNKLNMDCIDYSKKEEVEEKK